MREEEKKKKEAGISNSFCPSFAKVPCWGTCGSDGKVRGAKYVMAYLAKPRTAGTTNSITDDKGVRPVRFV